MTLCAHCGRDITDRVQRILNLERGDLDLEIVCDPCWQNATAQAEARRRFGRIAFSIKHPKLASVDELLDCLEVSDLDDEQKDDIIEELRKRYREMAESAK